MKIAIDFDGTIVEHRYPAIGKEVPFATDTIKKLIQQGHQIILWTVREGELMQEAVDWCEQRGLAFYAVNANYPGETPEDKHYSRKLKADLFIDDRNVGGLPDWGLIAQMVEQKKTYKEVLMARLGATPEPKKKRWGLF